MTDIRDLSERLWTGALDSADAHPVHARFREAHGDARLVRHPTSAGQRVEARLARALAGAREVKDLLDQSAFGDGHPARGAAVIVHAGLLAGISSGAAMAGAVKAAGQIDEGVVVTLFADGGWKYLSTGVWTDPLDEVVERLKSTVYF